MGQLDQVAQRSRSLLAALPTNRAYFDGLSASSARALEDHA
jgi:hypothetical protein